MSEPVPPFYTCEETLAFIQSLDVSVMKLGTGRMCAVLAELKQPQDRIRTIHVVGTNGKGSTSAMLESIYRAAGYRTGLFTSPHLVALRERIRLNGEEISVPKFVKAARAVYAAMIVALPAREDWLTHFEFLNALAFQAFADLPVDIAVIEAGLGGRLDSTNTILRPEAVVITPISMDHMERLGNTLSAIAGEKAAVMRPGVPTITASQAPEVMTLLSRYARQLYAPEPVTCVPERITLVGLRTTPNGFLRTARDGKTGKSFQLGLAGRYQAVNTALAMTVVETLQREIPVSVDQMASGLRDVVWPGRFQLVDEGLIIDGSHNPAGIETLLETLTIDFPGRQIIWGLSLLENRPVSWLEPLVAYPGTAAVSLLAPAAENANRFHPPQALDDLKSAVPRDNIPWRTGHGLATFLAMPTPPGMIRIVTGSLYTAGAALALLSQKKPAPVSR